MNPIGWCDITINPITGCRDGCEYCYARKMAYRLKGRFGYPEDEPFRPTFHPDRLDDIWNLRGTGKRIFLNSMSDWFGPCVQKSWLKSVLLVVDSKPEHTFLVLTKRPDNIYSYMMDGSEPWMPTPKNLWIGVSITCQRDAWRIKSLRSTWHGHRFVSFEPLHGPIDTDLRNMEWLIIGAESGNRKGRIEPKEDWVKSIFNCTPDTTPIFMKDNLMQYLPEWSQLRAFPGAML